jgi:hypothetical protein
MVFRWLVNAGLLAIPIGATIGVLLGIDSHRQTIGQSPLFSGGGNTDSGSGSGSGGGSGNSSGSNINNGITITQYCQKSFGISPPSKGEAYTCE